ncbi:glycosyltransferase [Oscillospiraceae bacterium WX1]
MVKVLNIISDANIGGAGRVLLNYLRFADTNAFETAVCLPRGSLLAEPLRNAGASVVEADIKPNASFSPADIKTLQKIIRQLNPDIVHTHGSLSGRIAARRCHKAVITTRHSVFPVSPRLKSGPGHLLNKIINEHYADRFIAVSPAAKENLTDGGIRGDMIDVVMNGVEPITHVSPNERTRIRAEYGLCDDDFAAGILARLEPYKGQALILDAAKILKDDGLPIRIFIAGAGPDEQALHQKALSLGLDDTVTFLGFVTDVAPLLNALDVQLNASYGTEASSLSLLEGMSLGLPAIVSDYGGNPFVIENGVNGLVFKSRDTKALAVCIRRLVGNTDLLSRLSASAEVVFRERFTGETFAGNIERIYRDVLKGDHDG